MTAKFGKVDARFDSLEDRIPAMGRIADFEARVLEVEKKLATVIPFTVITIDVMYTPAPSSFTCTTIVVFLATSVAPSAGLWAVV